MEKAQQIDQQGPIRHIAVATGTRADWGLLSPIAKALSERNGVKVSILATNMHLEERYGLTVNEIINDGFEVAARIPMTDGDDDHSKVVAMVDCMRGTADALAELKPDMIVILGDRYEMLAMASAAMMMHVPIAHISGGEISEGAIDDSIRHAITKLSSLHLTATEPYRRRVIQLGEQPKRVFNTGAIGVYNITHQEVIPRSQLEEELDFKFGEQSVIVTFHPVTLDPTPESEQIEALLSALDRFPDTHVLFTYPNSDAGSAAIIERIEAYGAANPGRVKVVKSLGHKRYLSVLRCVNAAVGNSSSGIVEVPSMHIPTVDIGIRQAGRLASQSVIHCKPTAKEIYRALNYALSPTGQELARCASNPYSKSDTLKRIVDAIVNAPLDKLKTKKFYDLNLA